MTRKEMKINERNIKIRELINSDSFDDIVVVENYDPVFASCYGSLQEIRLDTFGKVYKKYHKIMLGNYWQRRGTSLIVNKSDVKYIWKNRYIILKRGGVFDIATGFFIIKKEFLKAKYLWERKVRNHEIWDSYQIQNFDEFGMSYKEYQEYKERVLMLEQYHDEVNSLLEFYGYQCTYERNEYDHLIYVDDNGNKFSLTNLSETVSFKYNDTDYNSYNFEDGYNKIKELLVKGDGHNE